MKKILYVLIILTVVLTCVLTVNINAVVIPRVGIATPSSGTVEVGGTIRYTVTFRGATSVNLKPSDVGITGASANISIEGGGNEQRVIVLSNIQGSVGSKVYISWLAGGVASNSAGNSAEFNGRSSYFTIVATQAPAPAPGNNNNNNSGGYLPPVDNGGYNNSGDNGQSEAPAEEPKEDDDKENPKMKLGDLSSTSVQKGEAISFEVKYSDNKEIDKVTLSKKDITLYGFTADIQITGDGTTRKVTLSNIQGNLGGLKYIRVAKETAQDKAGNKVQEKADTAMFRLIDKDTKNKPADWIENPNTGR